MKKIIYLSICLLSVMASCDPEFSMDSIIVNNTDSTLSVYFVSQDRYMDLLNNTKILKIESGSKEYFMVIPPDLGGRIYMPPFTDHDSIYIKNSSDQILKVYKQQTLGKNIYNIDEFWSIKETKHHTEYTYTITNEDIGN